MDSGRRRHTRIIQPKHVQIIKALPGTSSGKVKKVHAVVVRLGDHQSINELLKVQTNRII